MASGKRASMREGPLAALFRRTEDDEGAPADAAAPAAPPAADAPPAAQAPPPAAPSAAPAPATPAGQERRAPQPPA
jgi:cell division protein FtsZ